MFLFEYKQTPVAWERDLLRDIACFLLQQGPFVSTVDMAAPAGLSEMTTLPSYSPLSRLSSFLSHL